MVMSQRHSRRDVLKALGAAPLAISTAVAETQSTPTGAPNAQPSRSRLCLVSRHLQWTDVEEGAAAAAAGGCKAVSWTIRRGAHILPENVERDLPRAVDAARKA